MNDVSAIDRPAGRAAVWLASAAALLLAPLLVFVHFPSQDGPAHLNAALTLRALTDRRAPFTDYFFAKATDPTNAAVTLILQGLSRLAPADQLDRLYVSLYVLIFCGVAWFCVRRVLKAGVVGFLLLCALVFSHMLHMGSYNLTLAYTGFLLVISLCCAHLRAPHGARLIGIGGALLATYFLHVQVALLAALCVALTGAAMLLPALQGREGRPTVREGFRQAALLAVSGLPTAVFFLVFYLRNADSLEAVSRLSHIGLLGKGVHLALLSGVANYSVFGLAVSATLASLLIALSVLAFGEMRRRGVRAHDLLGLFAIVLTTIYVVIPNGLGEALNIEERVMIPLLMTAICWIGVSTPLAGDRRVALAALAILALQTTDRTIAFHYFNQRAAQALSLRAHIPPGAAMIAVDVDQVARLPGGRDWRRPFDSALRFQPFANVGGLILGDRPVAWVNNYEAEITRPYFTLKQQAWLVDLLGPENPTFAFMSEEKDGALAKIVARLPSARHPVAYLVLWSDDPRSIKAPKVSAALRVVRSRYEEVGASPDGSGIVLRLKASPPA